MFFSKAFGEQRVANRAWERNVDDPAFMQMADFRVCEAELAASEAMRVHGNLWPRRDCLFKCLEQLHDLGSLNHWMQELGCSIHHSSVSGGELDLFLWRLVVGAVDAQQGQAVGSRRQILIAEFQRERNDANSFLLGQVGL